MFRAPSERKSSLSGPVPLCPRRLLTVSGQPRDLRKIDSRIPNLVPTILVRKEAILVRSPLTCFSRVCNQPSPLLFSPSPCSEQGQHPPHPCPCQGGHGRPVRHVWLCGFTPPLRVPLPPRGTTSRDVPIHLLTMTQHNLRAKVSGLPYEFR